MKRENNKQPVEVPQQLGSVRTCRGGAVKPDGTYAKWGFDDTKSGNHGAGGGRKLSTTVT